MDKSSTVWGRGLGGYAAECIHGSSTVLGGGAWRLGCLMDTCQLQHGGWGLENRQLNRYCLSLLGEGP